MPFLSHGGISLRYERVGAGLPLVFVHGLMANHTFWDRQVPLRRQFQIIRMDLRGHGDSSKPRGAFGMATLATDVDHLVNALGLQRCVLVGWSMGGVVAQEALRLLGSKLVGLVLVNTTPFAGAADGFPHGLTPEEQQRYMASASADYRNFARDLASRCFREESKELVQWATQQMLKTPPYVATATLQGLFAADERRALASIAIPTLICHGQHDTIFPLEAAQYLHKEINGSHLVTFEHSAHCAMIEETDRFNAELTAFAEKLVGSASAASPMSEEQPETPAPAVTPAADSTAAARSTPATPRSKQQPAGRTPAAALSAKSPGKKSPAKSAGPKSTAKRGAAKPTARRPPKKT